MIKKQKKRKNKINTELVQGVVRNKLLKLETLDTSLADRFKAKFCICEIIYKTILSKYLESNNQSINNLKINMNQVNPALKYAGYHFENSLLNVIFSSQDKKGAKSAKILRNELTHTLSLSAIKELQVREKELFDAMDQFLDGIR